MLFTFVSVWASISPPTIPEPGDARFGYFDNAAYIGPLTSALSNTILLALFILTFGTTTGAHFNPTVTVATFCARLCTLPRMILYVAFQMAGASLGGLLVRAGYGTRQFKTGGCWLFPEEVEIMDAFAIEVTTCTLFLFLIFGVGLDPRQQQVIPRSLSPFLVGMTLGILGWVTGYSRYGYGGVSLNPARCFGTYVGSAFPAWHWIHW
ncbi:aquaporin-like protein [Myriangium duriaei CBS 260.36]|uniref:Aquaporin-like protein n=1 Tax=Myriangium duriaei CBS 260.36 TaxID=1168546 RepID=A0A9P4MDS2_9PEZI|nr:aquaporin-like protein [Myriangium duriaei CBS 260.36]